MPASILMMKRYTQQWNLFRFFYRQGTIFMLIVKTFKVMSPE